MKQAKFSVNEVISHVEDKIISDIATYEEEVLYQDYKWSGKLKNNNTYKELVKEMNKLWNEVY